LPLTRTLTLMHLGNSAGDAEVAIHLERRVIAEEV
jgi:hypothetical protein